MKRHELEHVIRAAGTIADTRELVIFGSQSILGAYPDPPGVLSVSQEVDTYPLAEPEKADLIDGSIGELSPFHEEFGYYAHGVGPETAVLPRGWQTRWIRVENENTRGVTGLCLHPVDLAISKLAAGRPKDTAFVSAMIHHKLVSESEMRDVLEELEADQVERVAARLSAIVAAQGQ